ncbi:hypothetical protein EMCRGX_G021805 [Ephydatia muelleri]
MSKEEHRMIFEKFCRERHWVNGTKKFELLNCAELELTVVLCLPVKAKILQSDNGREFVNEIVKEVVRSWPGEVVLINGRPRHSQSQGLVEKGNHLLAYNLDDLNTQVCRTLKKSPYEVVFGQPPRTTPFAELPKGKNPCIMEEDVADLIATAHTTVLRRGGELEGFDQTPLTPLETLTMSIEKNAERLKIQYAKRKRHQIKTYSAGDSVTECTVTGADCDDKMKVKKRKPIKNAKHKSVAAMITSVQSGDWLDDMHMDAAS